MANQGEFSAGGVTRVTRLPVPTAGLRGEIFYLAETDGAFGRGLYKIRETDLEWVSIGGGGIGQVYITGATPITGKNVSKEETIADGYVLSKFRTDYKTLSVHVRALAGPSGYKPEVTVNGVLVTDLAIIESSGPEWEGSAQITLPDVPLSPEVGVIVASHVDGAKSTCEYELKPAPDVVLANFTGVYPQNPDDPSITQTELSSGNTFQVYAETNVEMTHIEVMAYGAATTTQLLAVTPGTSGTVTFTVGDRGDTPTVQGLKVRARDADGSFGDPFTITPAGNDGVDQLTLNNVIPSVSFGAITYPVGQQAIKDSESVTVTVTSNNHDMGIAPVFSSAAAQLDMSSGTLNSPFTMSRIAGGYNISTNNAAVTVYRSTNGRKASIATQVKIAHDQPTITISMPAARLRSNVSVVSHTITLTSNQNLIQLPSLEADSGGSRGTFTGAWSGNGKVFTKTLQVVDADDKGTFSFEGLAVTNLAGKTAYTLSGTLDYVLGGFLQRTLNIPAAFGTSAAIGTEVVSTGKLVCYHNGKDRLFTYTAVDAGALDKYTIDNSDTWRCLDDVFNSSNATGYTITLEETV